MRNMGFSVMRLLPPTMRGRLLVGASILQAIIVISLEAIMAYKILGDATTERGIGVYVAIFVLALLWSILFAWDCVLQENSMQLFVLVAFNLLTAVYSGFQIFQLKEKDVTPFLACVSVFLIAFTIIFGVLSCYLYIEFGWRMYKRLGADPKIRKIHYRYLIFITVLKLDFFFLLGYFLQYVTLVLVDGDAERYVTGVAIPVVVGLMFLAYFGVRKENKIAMCIAIGSIITSFPYFIYKLVKIQTSDKMNLVDTRKFLTFFASLSLTMLVATFVNAIVCLRNFHNGLLPRLEEHRNPRKAADVLHITPYNDPPTSNEPETSPPPPQNATP